MTQEKENRQSGPKESSSQPKLLKIEREFSAPIARLYEAFTNAEALKAWWWPKDLYSDRVDLDFREGGKYFINMKGYDQGGGGMTGEFTEIIPNRSIVMTDHFADKEGNPISAKEAKMPGEWPEVIQISLHFSLGEGNASHLSLSQTGIPNELQKDCRLGWSESFDKLEEHLAKQKH